jgi:hypothetical protein
MAAAFFLFEAEERAHSRFVAGEGTGESGYEVNAWMRGLPPRAPSRW